MGHPKVPFQPFFLSFLRWYFNPVFNCSDRPSSKTSCMWYWFFHPVLCQLIFRLLITKLRLISGKLFWTGASCIFTHVALVFLKAEQSGWGLPLNCSVIGSATPPWSNLQRTQGTKMLGLNGEFVLVPHCPLWKLLRLSIMFWYAHARLFV